MQRHSGLPLIDYNMGTEQQMFLAVAPRASLSHLNKPARQLVPAFLQKLYEYVSLFDLISQLHWYLHPSNRMVNDPSQHDLIRWSDTGDSFFGVSKRYLHYSI